MEAKQTRYAELAYIRRVVKKVSAQDMADLLGVNKETYLRSERGGRDITLEEAVKIAHKFNMNLAEVFPKFFVENVAI
ncbi:helix-turn-helix transcriptional regulator [Paenibacillus sp. FSL L8-0708]|uniref:helix-turn-helix transcriptional regulator n=1 Tax=Paenibacillus sp. FSL L8-0708 TaxID=2975311 RepID=UPI0030F9AC64